jgi:CRP/FNR family transcriptional regulator
MRADGAKPKPSASHYCRAASGEKSGRSGQAPKSAAIKLLTDIGFLGGGSKPQRLARNQVLAGEGQVGRQVFAVVEGALASYRSGEDGKPQVFAFHFPGDLITLAWPDGVMPVTLKAIMASQVFSLTEDALRAVLHRDADCGLALFGLLASHLAGQQGGLFNQHRRSVERRLADFLIESGRHLGVLEGMRLVITLPMRRCEIASYLGLRSETLSRIFARWRAIGLIEQGDLREICFPDVRRLEAIGCDRH